MLRTGLTAVLCLALSLASCERAGSNTASPSAKPSAPFVPRIAALAPAVAVILRDMDLGDRIVARHGYDAWTNPNVPVAGEQDRIDYEALLRTRPTHVVLQWGDRPMPARLVDLSLQHHWTLVSLPLLTVDDVRTAVTKLGQMFIPPDPVPGFEKTALDRLLPALDRAFAQRPGIDTAKVGRILLLNSANPPAALGPGSYHHQVLQRLGATPSLATGTPYVPMDAEDVLRLNPDAIILIQPRESAMAPFATPRDAASLRARLGPLAALDISAIRRDRIALIDDPLCLIPGTNLIDFANELADILSAWSAEPAPARAR